MHRHGYALQLTQYDEGGWRATFYTTGMEHSPTSATGMTSPSCVQRVVSITKAGTDVLRSRRPTSNRGGRHPAENCEPAAPVVINETELPKLIDEETHTARPDAANETDSMPMRSASNFSIPSGTLVAVCTFDQLRMWPSCRVFRDAAQ
jgi:hypothetical protein